MKQDKFDEFYMLQTQAKGLEKRHKNEAALKIYLEILENYFPDTDFSYKRAITLLQLFNRDDEIMPIVDLALERITNKEIKGDITYFQAFKLKASEKEKEAHKFNIEWLKQFDLKRVAFWGIYTIIAILLSLPLKIYKFIFIILVAITIWLIIEIARRIQLKFSVNRQIIALLASLVLGAFSAAQLPPPEWTSFFSLAPLAEVGHGTSPTTISTTDAHHDNADSDVELTDKDLETLNTVYNDELVLNGYTVDIDHQDIMLTLFVKDTALDSEIKEVAENILVELNHIKGGKSYEDRLGDLFKTYKATILAYESQQRLRLKGETNKYTLKIKWK